LNVHPSSVSPLGPTTKEPFAPGALYEIKIDKMAMPFGYHHSAQFASSKMEGRLRHFAG